MNKEIFKEINGESNGTLYEHIFQSRKNVKVYMMFDISMVPYKTEWEIECNFALFANYKISQY